MPKMQCCLCPSWYTKEKLKYKVPELPDDTLGKLYMYGAYMYAELVVMLSWWLCVLLYWRLYSHWLLYSY